MNLEDILNLLMNNAKGSFSSEIEKIKYVERNGIVFLDEIDKKGSRSNEDVSGRGVLNSLLEFLTGADYEVGQGYKSYKFNTKNLTIFAAGAFTNVMESAKKANIGFGSSAISNQAKLTVENIMRDGSIPNELMGRFHKIINLNPISKEVLSEIITASKKSTLTATQSKLKNLGIDLTWDDTFINKVAEEAYKRKLGARSLKSIIEETLFEIQWHALNQTSSSTVIATAETVDNPKQFILKPKNP